MAVLGGLTLVLGLVSGYVHSRVYLLSEPTSAVLVGVAVGPVGLDLLHIEFWGHPETILEQVARLTVAVAVMGAALCLPATYFRDHARTMVTLPFPGMAIMWLVSGLSVHLLLGFPFWVTMLVEGSDGRGWSHVRGSTPDAPNRRILIRVAWNHA